MPSLCGLGRHSVLLVCQLVVSAASMPLHAQPALSAVTDVRVDTLGIERYVAQQMRRNRIPGVSVAIVAKDSVIYAQGFGTDGFGAAVTERTGFVLGSMSKSVTALAVMQLVEREAMIRFEHSPR